jgi:hypothetical protein
MADELILTLDYERAPSAEDLGGLFSALARDYREMTKGRTLVVVRVDAGSIVVTLTDAAIAAAHYAVPAAVGGLAVVTTVNALAEFAENLAKWLVYAKGDKDKKRLYRKGKKSPGQRSVEAIIKTAADARSHVHVMYKSGKGETLEVELTPAEAISARQQLVVREETKKVRDESTDATIPAPPELQGAIEHFRQIGALNLSPTEVHALVAAIVAVLQAAGAGHLLPKIALALEMRGLYNIAEAVRKHIR